VETFEQKPVLEKDNREKNPVWFLSFKIVKGGFNEALTLRGGAGILLLITEVHLAELTILINITVYIFTTFPTTIFHVLQLALASTQVDCNSVFKTPNICLPDDVKSFQTVFADVYNQLSLRWQWLTLCTPRWTFLIGQNGAPAHVYVPRGRTFERRL